MKAIFNEFSMKQEKALKEVQEMEQKHMGREANGTRRKRHAVNVFLTRYCAGVETTIDPHSNSKHPLCASPVQCIPACSYYA